MIEVIFGFLFGFALRHMVDWYNENEEPPPKLTLAEKTDMIVRQLMILYPRGEGRFDWGIIDIVAKETGIDKKEVEAIIMTLVERTA